MPVDCPSIELETVRHIARALHSPENPLLVIPRFDGERGHPVCARRELISEFLELPPAGRAKDVVHRHRDRTRFLDLSDPGVLRDIDNPQAYRVLLKNSQQETSR